MPTSTDLVISPEKVKAGIGAMQVTGVAGATITAGQALYLDAATSTYKLASASTRAEADFKGVALCNSAPGQPVVIDSRDPSLFFGFVGLDKGKIYCVSATTPGGIIGIDALLAGSYISIVGIANSRRTFYVTTGLGTRSTAPKA